MDSQPSIFGYSWEQIKAKQQGERVAPIDLSKPAKKPATDKDKALFAQHGEQGLRKLELWGVIDRLGLPLS